MQETLENFFRALRAADIPVTPAEAIDAHRAVNKVGYGDRVLLKDTLCVELAKSADESRRFDNCFDLFFRREEFRGSDNQETVVATRNTGWHSFPMSCLRSFNGPSFCRCWCAVMAKHWRNGWSRQRAKLVP